MRGLQSVRLDRVNRKFHSFERSESPLWLFCMSAKGLPATREACAETPDLSE